MKSTRRIRAGARSRPTRLAAAIATGALVLAACGSDDDSGSEAAETTAAAAETTAAPAATEDTAPTETDAPVEDTAPAETDAPAAPTGEPIKVMAAGPIESPVFSLPSIPIGAQIAVDEINAAGGVNGRPLELLVCNDEANPNKATECVQQAIDEGAVAFVGGLSIFAANIVPLGAQSDLAFVGLSAAGAFESTNLFNIAADGATVFAGAGAAAVEAGCTSAATITSALATPLNGPSLKAGVEAAGGEVVIELQAGADFAPLVESAIAAGAECIVSGVSPGETGPLIAAIGGRLPFSTLDGSLPAALAAGLGEAAEGIPLVAGFIPPGAGNDKVDELAATSLEIAPEVSLDQFWYSGYAGVYLVAEAAKGLDEVSPAAVLEGLSGITGFDTGIGPVVDFSANVGVPGFESIYNTKLYLMQISGGRYELVQEEPIDMKPAIELLAQ